MRRHADLLTDEYDGRNRDLIAAMYVLIGLGAASAAAVCELAAIWLPSSEMAMTGVVFGGVAYIAFMGALIYARD